jgi:hypothetical protein
MSEFNFKTAQEHELNWQLSYIESNLPYRYKIWKKRRDNREPDSLLTSWFPPEDQWNLRDEFLKHIKGKNVLDIGCGSIPQIREMWGNEKIVIDPLANEYILHQDKLFGGSFFRRS